METITRINSDSKFFNGLCFDGCDGVMLELAMYDTKRSVVEDHLISLITSTLENEGVIGTFDRYLQGPLSCLPATLREGSI